jgi:hypothetical protein
MTQPSRRRTIPIIDVRSQILSRTRSVPVPLPRVRHEIAQHTGKATSVRSLADGEQPISDLLKEARPAFQIFREGKYTHVSDIISKCARKIALIRRLGSNHTPHRLLDGHAITFAQGDAIHDFVKKRFVEGHPDKVWASWQCRCGTTTTPPMLYKDIDEAMVCRVCRSLPFKYVEVLFADNEYEVIGSPDLLLYLNAQRAYYITELKSISSDLWDRLERPQPDHIIQTLFYWKLLRANGYPLVDQVSILYVKKEYTWKWPYREFVVKPEEQLHRLEDFLRDLGQIRDARESTNPLPPRLVCGTPNSPEAKQCPVCVTCFQLK